MLAEILPYNKSALCRRASPAFSFVLLHTLSDVWLQHLFDERSGRRNQSVISTRCMHGPLLSNSFNNLLETENLSRITISIHQTRRSRRASHDLVLIFPIWSCMSCNKLLQSHLLRHFHYLNGISLVIWLLHVLYLVVCMSWKLYALVSC